MDRTVRVWDVFTGEELAQFTGHRGPVYCVAFSPDGKTVASGSADTTVLLWDVSRLGGTPPASPGDPKTLADLWASMREHEAAKAYPALWELVGAGENAVGFLAQHLRPTPAPHVKRIKGWLADLDSDDFAKRQTAVEQLTRLGQLAEPALRQALEAKPPIEVRKRLEQMLAEIAEHPFTPEDLRAFCALYALELIGSPAARDLLKKLADGAPGAALTRDAKLALERLERRTNKP